MIIGLLGGYPVGAREITAAYNSGTLSRHDAQRMLGFCSNAGPSFIFGIIACQFLNKSVGIWIFLIQILSAILTAVILPGKTSDMATPKTNNYDFISIIHNSIHSIVSVCGWVILFRIALSFLDRWVLWLLPDYASVILTGILELANGCTQLKEITNDGFRMIVSSAILSFGGICVYLQTLSVTKGLGAGLYFPGKVIHCCISIMLSSIVQLFLFDRSNTVPILYLSVPSLIIVGYIIVRFSSKTKKRVAFQVNLMYNQ